MTWTIYFAQDVAGYDSCLAFSQRIRTDAGPMSARDVALALDRGPVMTPNGPLCGAVFTEARGITLRFDDGARVVATRGHQIVVDRCETLPPRLPDWIVGGDETTLSSFSDVEPGAIIAGRKVVDVERSGAIDAVRLWGPRPFTMLTPEGIELGTRWHEIMPAWCEGEWCPSQWSPGEWWFATTHIHAIRRVGRTYDRIARAERALIATPYDQRGRGRPTQDHLIRWRHKGDIGDMDHCARVEREAHLPHAPVSRELWGEMLVGGREVRSRLIGNLGVPSFYDLPISREHVEPEPVVERVVAPPVEPRSDLRVTRRRSLGALAAHVEA